MTLDELIEKYQKMMTAVSEEIIDLASKYETRAMAHTMVKVVMIDEFIKDLRSVK